MVVYLTSATARKLVFNVGVNDMGRQYDRTAKAPEVTAFPVGKPYSKIDFGKGDVTGYSIDLRGRRVRGMSCGELPGSTG